MSRSRHARPSDWRWSSCSDDRKLRHRRGRFGDAGAWSCFAKRAARAEPLQLAREVFQLHADDAPQRPGLREALPQPRCIVTLLEATDDLAQRLVIVRPRMRP